MPQTLNEPGHLLDAEMLAAAHPLRVSPSVSPKCVDSSAPRILRGLIEDVVDAFRIGAEIGRGTFASVEPAAPM